MSKPRIKCLNDAMKCYLCKLYLREAKQRKIPIGEDLKLEIESKINTQLKEYYRACQTKCYKGVSKDFWEDH